MADFVAIFFNTFPPFNGKVTPLESRKFALKLRTKCRLDFIFGFPSYKKGDLLRSGYLLDSGSYNLWGS
jgi:hypothetical protein